MITEAADWMQPTKKASATSMSGMTRGRIAAGDWISSTHCPVTDCPVGDHWQSTNNNTEALRCKVRVCTGSPATVSVKTSGTHQSSCEGKSWNCAIGIKKLRRCVADRLPIELDRGAPICWRQSARSARRNESASECRKRMGTRLEATL